MRTFFFKKQKGVTLTELMAVMAIVSIMAGVAFVSLQNSRTEGEVKAAAREVAAAVRSVQNDALSGKKIKKDDCSSSVQEYAFYYGIGTTSGNATLTSVQYKVEGCNAQDVVTLEKGVEFSSTGTSNKVGFAPVTGKQGGSNQIIVTKGTVSYSVCISSTGSVEEKSGQVC